MGNGKGVISVDIETTGLSLKDIEDAAAKSAASFGQASQIFAPLQSFFMFQGTAWAANPQYTGTEWMYYNRITKREHAFAKLQCFLLKFGLQKHLEDDDARRADANLAAKRLKRAKWARYQKAKVQSTP